MLSSDIERNSIASVPLNSAIFLQRRSDAAVPALLVDVVPPFIFNKIPQFAK
jgi:hypothetical protein